MFFEFSKRVVALIKQHFTKQVDHEASWGHRRTVGQSQLVQERVEEGTGMPPPRNDKNMRFVLAVRGGGVLPF